MKNTSLTFCSLLLTASLLSAAPVGKYPSLPSKVLSNYKPKPVSDHSSEALAKSANTFLSSLNNELKAQAALPYKSKEKAKRHRSRSSSKEEEGDEDDSDPK
ncbi:MAG: hypothetical protein VXW02_10455 [Verrucomicrobiota bacterium]|nr:hypothetical protein [Verrucomicrobiota bacterium]